MHFVKYNISLHYYDIKNFFDFLKYSNLLRDTHPCE